MPEFSAYPLPEVDLNTSRLTFYEVNIKVALATCISPHWVNAVLCDKGFIEEGVMRSWGKRENKKKGKKK